MNSAPLILASASPRRVELLRLFSVPFEVVPSGSDELHDETVSAHELCATNARRKAEEIAHRFPDKIVLGADTLVTLNGKLFGKPANLEDAAAMLGQLSGKAHQVITGVCLREERQNREELFTVETEVTFKTLTAGVIITYIATVPVLDKAGAYAIQEHGGMLVAGIKGSLSNVIGLPVERLAQGLCAWNLISPRERDRIVASQGRADPEISELNRK
jgi:septum formation protein